MKMGGMELCPVAFAGRRSENQSQPQSAARAADMRIGASNKDVCYREIKVIEGLDAQPIATVMEDRSNGSRDAASIGDLIAYLKLKYDIGE